MSRDLTGNLDLTQVLVDVLVDREVISHLPTKPGLRDAMGANSIVELAGEW